MNITLIILLGIFVFFLSNTVRRVKEIENKKKVELFLKDHRQSKIDELYGRDNSKDDKPTSPFS